MCVFLQMEGTASQTTIGCCQGRKRTSHTFEDAIAFIQHYACMSKVLVSLTRVSLLLCEVAECGHVLDDPLSTYAWRTKQRAQCS